MDYKVLQLTAVGGNVTEAVWHLSHTIGPLTMARSGLVRVTAPTPYAGLTEAAAVTLVKTLLGLAFFAEVEAELLAAMASASTVVQGAPWMSDPMAPATPPQFEGAPPLPVYNPEPPAPPAPPPLTTTEPDLSPVTPPVIVPPVITLPPGPPIPPL